MTQLTEEQKLLLEMIAEELGGTLRLYTGTDKFYQWSKIEIEYGKRKKTND